MYGRPGIVYGFHGCDRRIGESVLASHTTHLKPSKNEYDWLGHGIYFWEASPERALEFARDAKIRKKISQGRIKYPYAVGAVIELGNCLNLLDHSGLMEIRAAYKMLKSSAEAEGKQLPNNKHRDKSGAFLLRALDCAVLEYLYQIRRDAGLPPYDTVIGAIWEGDDLYDDAGITDKNHIQICIRNAECIRGYFRVRELDGISLSRWDSHPIGPRYPRLGNIFSSLLYDCVDRTAQFVRRHKR